MTAYPAPLRSYINSEADADREHAQEECARLGIDYDAMRRQIIAEMVAEYEANEPARERRRAAKETGGRSIGPQKPAQRA